jgi:hypothetical protein
MRERIINKAERVNSSISNNNNNNKCVKKRKKEKKKEKNLMEILKSCSK